MRRFSVANPLDFRDKATLNLASGLRTLGQFITAGDTPKVRMPGGTRMHALVPSFVGLIAGMASVAWVASFTNIAFLWHNVVGAVAVVVVGIVVSLIERAVTGSRP